MAPGAAVVVVVPLLLVSPPLGVVLGELLTLFALLLELLSFAVVVVGTPLASYSLWRWAKRSKDARRYVLLALVEYLEPKVEL